MRRTFAELYLTEAYPAMSHPSADPQINAEVARACGLDVADLAQGRILDIGCGTGHHILSLANRWRGAKCTGVDISAESISRARNLARQAYLDNVEFCEGSILESGLKGEFDVVIAHGVFSWVPDEVKLGLMDFIGRRLAPGGIAIVSFNVAAGWRERIEVVAKVRAVQVAGQVDEMTALSVMRTAVKGREAEIVDDMLAKGAEVLAFDDFGPVMDAWSLGAVIKLAEACGLKWLGDSVTGERGNDLRDNAEKKTFRSEVFCRADAKMISPTQGVEIQAAPDRRVPDFPKLDAWRLVCARECLPLPDAELNPCRFTFPQLRVLAAMDGSLSVMALADYSKKFSPELDFIPWLRHVAERGFFV